jgi:hypothetical protein
VPKFLEDKLKAEYGNNPHAIYGTMNKIGAMRGNKETAKGAAMQAKHNRKVGSEPPKPSEPHAGKKASHPGLTYKHVADGSSHPGMRYK